MDSSPAILFNCLAFDQLSTAQLYEIMALRQAVFVVEQNCPYLDADGHDQVAFHLLCQHRDGTLVAYTRLFGPGSYYPGYASIGRVATADSVRGTGLGRNLLQESIRQIGLLFNSPGIKISAQSYLIKFYESFGFISVGEEYLEDGIPHISMIRPEVIWGDIVMW